MPKASRVMPMLSVADMAASRRFYETLLGGQLVYQFPPEGEPAFLTLSFGATELGRELEPEQPGVLHRLDDRAGQRTVSLRLLDTGLDGFADRVDGVEEGLALCLPVGREVRGLGNVAHCAKATTFRPRSAAFE